MPGIYIHIPFCRKLCYYCDFHFTVSLKQKDRVIRAIISELEIRKKHFLKQKINTIYFGGGTPSILTSDEISYFIGVIEKNYDVIPGAEITIEANPDDLTPEYLKELHQKTPVNRLSIGVQSFNDQFLKLMNRRHSANEAHECIKVAGDIGYENINIDLIYGIPGMELEHWKKDLMSFSESKIPHLSAYHLSIEPKTVFAYYQKKGKLIPISEEDSLNQFDFLMHFVSELGYDHYEISNFALPNYYSKHNVSYWTGKSYIGIGPSAHSYNFDHRRWNIANNTKYCEELENGREGYYEIEVIDQHKGFNDYLITSLRTKWGINLKTIENKFGSRMLQYIDSPINGFLKDGLLSVQDNNICLSNKGKRIADYIIRELMIE